MDATPDPTSAPATPSAAAAPPTPSPVAAAHASVAPVPSGPFLPEPPRPVADSAPSGTSSRSPFDAPAPNGSGNELPVLLAAVVVGSLTGLLAVAFRQVVILLETGGHRLRELPEPWGDIATVLLPAVGMLAVGRLVHRYVGGGTGHGVPAVIRAVAADRPMNDWRTAARAGSSTITIGSGGSAGPEGPIVELGAVAGSAIGTWLRMPGTATRTMMGGGAAAGIAAVFNAGLGGVMFVVEVVMRDFSARMLAPLLLSAVAASSVAALFFGSDPAFPVPHFEFRGWELPVAVAVGAGCGAIAALFVLSVQAGGSLAVRLPVPPWVRPGVAGLIVGLIALLHPADSQADYDTAGEGYDTIGRLLQHGGAFGILAALVGLKLLATAITLGSGAPGGAFAPSLVLGAAGGAAVIAGLRLAWPGLPLDPAVAGLFGMAGLIAAAFQAPLSGLLIALQLGGGRNELILPLMVVVVIASWVARRLADASIYDLVLMREGVDVQAVAGLNRILARRPVEELMTRCEVTFRAGQNLGEVLDAVGRSEQSVFPLLDADGACRGAVLLDDLRSVLREQQADVVLLAEDLARPADPVLRRGDSLAAAWDAFTRTRLDELPVLEPVAGADEPPKLAGLLRRRDLVAFLRVG